MATNKIEDLNKGSGEVLHALLNSIVPESTPIDGKLPPDVIHKLTEKLTELVGEEAVREFKQQRNERGEIKLLNEDGLPIIEITEPIGPNATFEAGNSLLAEEDTLIPLASIPPTVKERLRQERDRILDLLEAEEQQEQSQDIQTSKEQRQEILRKRKEAAAREKEKLNAAKEMQKKMGKALVNNIIETNEREGDVKEGGQIHNESPSSSANKKSVAFAELPEHKNDEDVKKPHVSDVIDWGDVTPARLRAANRPTLMSTNRSQNLPMKMAVVERTPMNPLKDTSNTDVLRDSDDESEPASPHLSDPDDNFPLDSSDYNRNHSVPPDSADESDENPILEDELDLTFAQHQREIALEYHKKRNTIGEAASAAMMSHTHNADEEIPLDMPIPESHSKPSISQFKASRFANSYNISTPSSSTATSLESSVLPASSARTLQRAIRVGKLDSGEKLVGGDAGESASEDENENIQEILQLLKKGEVYNIGPDGNFVHTIPPAVDAGSPKPPVISSGPGLSHTDLPPLNKPKTSKFKLSRTQGNQRPVSLASSSTDSPLSPSNTPISHAERSSPKLASSSLAPNTPPWSSSATTTPTIVESPSFLQPPNKSAVRRGSSPLATSSPFSMIVDSPSFPAQAGPTPQNQYPSKSQSFATPPSFPPPPTSRRPGRPPVIMSTTVRESTNTQSTHSTMEGEDADSEERPQRKMSRFLADRM